jgi:triosephosphate isomerase
MKKELLIVANWKMNKTKAEAKEYLQEFLKAEKTFNHKIVLAPSFTLLDYVDKTIQNTNVSLASQNMFFENNGAYTGEVSVNMLKDFNCEYVILGHSERRRYFLETDEIINKKVNKALSSNIKPIICIGETLQEKKQKLGTQVIKRQITKALNNVSKDNLKNIVLAYEPIWAIGTGQTATSDDANEMAEFIVNLVKTIFNTQTNVKVIYGGSVTEHNASNSFDKENLSGALIGGASLNYKSFLELIKY